MVEKKTLQKLSPNSLIRSINARSLIEMWVEPVAGFSFVFPLGIFSIILVLHSSGFDPDTKDAPKHLRALKTLAWALAGLCVYYNAGEIQEPLRSSIGDTIIILTFVLIIGLWYISKLPTWHRQLPKDQRREWREDPNPEVVRNRDDTERVLETQTNEDSEARREIWVVQQRGRFLEPGDYQAAELTIERIAMDCCYEAFHYIERRKHRPRENETLQFREVIWWIDQNDKTLRSVSEFTDRAQVCLKHPLLWIYGVRIDNFRTNFNTVGSNAGWSWRGKTWRES